MSASAPHTTGFGSVTLGGTVHDANGTALSAQADRGAAFTALGSQTCDTTYAGTKDLVGENLVAGVYCADAFELTGTLTLNGAATDVWIFKSASSLVTTGSTANIVFTGGGQACNVWWRVVSSATFDAGTEFVGNVLASTSITFATGATLDGRALDGTAEITLDSNTITGPTCTATADASATPGLPDTSITAETDETTAVNLLAIFFVLAVVGYAVHKSDRLTNR
ncbi:MAG: ice-binding family protein [Candidatus Saccharimonadales bacterium]